ncbi:hypothetical protein [Tenacibaculum crassostreae]|uniref:hypothetical protein n=1 Tax=Tenacibaculum crassostreae TaxID=502683 RepID=UPI0038955BA4
MTQIKSGFWLSSKGNPFWIKTQNNKVFWLGMNKKSNQTNMGDDWCHTAHGTITDNFIELVWSDIPIGKDELEGKINIEIINSIHLKVIEDSGNFGKSEWTWVTDTKRLSQYDREV